MLPYLPPWLCASELGAAASSMIEGDGRIALTREKLPGPLRDCDYTTLFEKKWPARRSE